MYKVVTLLKRRADMSVAEFHAYFRDVHGPLGTAHPEIRRYVQSYTLAQGYRGGELLFDGLSETWFDSAEGFAAYKRHPQTAAVLEDGANFLDISRTVVMPVEVHVMKDGTPAENGVKSIEFVNQREDMPLEDFRRYWREHHGPLACHIPFRRYEQNHLRLDAYKASRTPAFDGVAVTWFDSTEDMKATVGTPGYEATRADEAAFLRAGHLPFIITTEAVLKD